MKEIGNSQPPTAEPSKEEEKKPSSYYIDKKRKTLRTQNTHARKAPIEGRGTPEDLSQSIKVMLWRLNCEIRPMF